MKTEHLAELVEYDDPVGSVWRRVWDIWSPLADTVEEHYSRESSMVDYERELLDVYGEFYTDILPGRCVNQAALDVPEDGTFIVLDGMSVREAGLLVNTLSNDGYDPTVGYGFATVPSETIPFRERVGYDTLKREHKTANVGSQDPNLDGDEDIIWCRYPDALLETIQEGKTKISSIVDSYEQTEKALRSILEQLDSAHVVIGSDHGYVRLESGYAFSISEAQKNRLQETFGGRFMSVGETDADDLVDQRLVVESDGYYMPIGRYTWPAPGKYSTYQHGGMSIPECLTPRFELELPQ